MAFKSGTGTIQRFFEITPQTLELSFTGNSSSSVTANFNTNVSTSATFVLCDIFVTKNGNDHQNIMMGRSGQVGNNKNWVDIRGQQPSGQLQNMGANVIITEVDPLPGLRAVMDGFRVMKMDDAAPLGDIFCTATGMKDVLVDRHFNVMKDGAIVCNTGHYDCEINISDIEERAEKVYTIREDNEAFQLKDGRTIHLLARGRLVNLAAAEGQEHIVQLFIEHGAQLSPIDRWGGTPLQDAEKGNHKNIISLLKNATQNS